MKYITSIIAFVFTALLHYQFTDKPLYSEIDSLTQANYQLQFQLDSLAAQKTQMAHSFASVLLLPQNKAIKDSIINIIVNKQLK